MRVANIIEDGRVGGPQVRILTVAVGLKEQGIDTTVIIPSSDSNDFRARLAASLVPSQTMNLTRPGRELRTLAQYVALFPRDLLNLYRHFLEKRYDLVHCSGGAWQIKGLLAAWCAGIPTLWHLNDTAMPMPIRFVFKLLSGLPTAFIASGNRVRAYYFGRRALTVPVFKILPPVDCKRFEKSAISRSALLSDFGINIVLIANVNPIKGIDVFIRAAAIATRSSAGRLNFYIVGPIFESQRQYAAELERLVDASGLSNVHFLGGVSDVRPILKATDVFVCASHSEAGPMVLWEAMAMGCAVVSTDVGDVSSILRTGESGFVTPPGDHSSMSAAITALANDAGMRESFGLAARAIAVRDLSLEQCVQNHLTAYRATLASLSGAAA